LLVKVNDDSNTPLTSADLKRGEKQLIVYPYDPASKTLRDGSRLNRILVMKLDPSAMDDATRADAADGVVAYSAFCTHQGCDVSAWLPDEKNLMCFCHFSKFAPLKHGAVSNGPAAKPLAALPLKVEDGKLVVAGSFNILPGKGA
jgi:rieske iron-sulfur protein